MKYVLPLAVLVLASCDDSIPGLCRVDDDCASKTCYRGVCMAMEADAGDGGFDAVDAGPVCTPRAATEQNCSDGIDDDCDGLFDCADPDCTSQTCRAALGDCDVAEKCTSGVCPADVRKQDGELCDDHNACSSKAKCLAGACTPISSVTCPVPDDCHETGTCQPATGQCYHAPKAKGAQCEDGNLNTYSDQCDGAGHCRPGFEIICKSAPGPCGARRSANGTAACSVEYPDTSTNCDDGDPCTYDDHCNGAGLCVGGTSIICKDDSSTCGARRSCNGTATCAVAYPGPSTYCTNGVCGGTCNSSGRCIYTGSCKVYFSTCVDLYTCSSDYCQSTCSSDGTCVNCHPSDSCASNEDCGGQ